MKKITFIFVTLCITNLTFSQCISSKEYTGPAPTSTNDGFVQEIAFGIEAGEFAAINSLIIGDDYEFTSNRTATPNNDYITITDESNTVIAHGITPLTINSITVTIVRMHIHLDAGCNTDADFHDATIQSLTNAPTCYKPEIPGITYKPDTRIDFFWSAPSMSTPTGYDWEIVPSGNAQRQGFR